MAVSASRGGAVNVPACHPDRLIERRVNLDGDPAKEGVVAVDTHDCQHTTFRAYVHIRDRCGGEWRTYDLGSESQVLRRFRVVNADARTRRPEVFFATHELGPVARGISKVVRLDDRRSGCARVRELFRYAPGPAVFNFDVELKDVTRRFRGLEIVVTEGREVAQTITRHRYDRTRDRYVEYG